MTPALLDTDMLSELIKLKNSTVRQHALDYTQQFGSLAFSAITRYEVVRGYKQKKAMKQLARFAVFCQKSLILPVTDAIWDRASDLWAYARMHGHPHNDADMVIAASRRELRKRPKTAKPWVVRKTIITGMAKRPKHQHGIKRAEIPDWPDGVGTPDEVAERVTYRGSSLHKTYPSPAGPPALRADKAKCDFYENANWHMLLDALRQAIRARCVGPFRGGFPSRAWVWINGVLHEARLTGNGEFHGFPLDDPKHYPCPEDCLENAPHATIPFGRV